MLGKNFYLFEPSIFLLFLGKFRMFFVDMLVQNIRIVGLLGTMVTLQEHFAMLLVDMRHDGIL